MKTELTALEFIAFKISQNLAEKDGYSAAPHWLVSSEEHQQRCLVKAQEMVDAWANNEHRLETLRNELSADIPEIKVGGDWGSNPIADS